MMNKKKENKRESRKRRGRGLYTRRFGTPQERPRRVGGWMNGWVDEVI
jgi:hypothetical protein